jgi:hypothetical protein
VSFPVSTLQALGGNLLLYTGYKCRNVRIGSIKNLIYLWIVREARLFVSMLREQLFKKQINKALLIALAYRVLLDEWLDGEMDHFMQNSGNARFHLYNVNNNGFWQVV